MWNLLSKHQRDRSETNYEVTYQYVHVSRALSEATFSERSSSNSYFFWLLGGVWLWQHLEIERRHRRSTQLVASGNVAMI